VAGADILPAASDAEHPHAPAIELDHSRLLVGAVAGMAVDG